MRVHVCKGVRDTWSVCRVWGMGACTYTCVSSTFTYCEGVRCIGLGCVHSRCACCEGVHVRKGSMVQKHTNSPYP